MSQAIEHILVSVIIPTYNRAQLLPEAIESVQVQTHTNLEIIVVDDCSSDNTEEVVRELMKDDSRIKYYRLSKKGNANVARNYGVEKSEGEFLSFLDSDDVYLSNKIEDQLHLICCNEYDFVIGQSYAYSENLKKRGDKWSYLDKQVNPENYICNHIHVRWQTGSALWRRNYFDRIGGFDEKLNSSQEWDLHLRALLFSKNYGVLNSEIVKIRIHTSKTRVTNNISKYKNIDCYLNSRISGYKSIMHYESSKLKYCLINELWNKYKSICKNKNCNRMQKIKLIFKIMVFFMNSIEAKKKGRVFLVILNAKAIGYILINDRFIVEEAY